jgi:hypothetical protein
MRAHLQVVVDCGVAVGLHDTHRLGSTLRNVLVLELCVCTAQGLTKCTQTCSNKDSQHGHACYTVTPYLLCVGQRVGLAICTGRGDPVSLCRHRLDYSQPAARDIAVTDLQTQAQATLKLGQLAGSLTGISLLEVRTWKETKRRPVMKKVPNGISSPTSSFTPRKLNIKHKQRACGEMQGHTCIISAPAGCTALRGARVHGWCGYICTHFGSKRRPRA